MTILPYWTLDNAIDGVVLVLQDINEIKTASEQTAGIVERLGGSIRVRSRVSPKRSGTCFFSVLSGPSFECGLAQLLYFDVARRFWLVGLFSFEGGQKRGEERWSPAGTRDVSIFPFWVIARVLL